MEAALQYTLPPGLLASSTLTIGEGEELKLEGIVQKLTAAGYQRREQVEGFCQFSVRGGILDLFPPDSPSPIRVEFWGDSIDSLSYFDLETQRRTQRLEEVEILPAREVLYTPQQMMELIRTLLSRQRARTVNW